MHTYRNWFLASRPWSFTMTAISVSVGTTVAALGGHFSWTIFMISIFAAVLLHAATNLINDYYDVKNGVDTVEACTAQYRPHPLVEGKLKASQVAVAVSIMYSISALVGLFLILTRGWLLLPICLTGVFASLMYTAPPLKYKYHALGEMSVFLMWGPLMVEGAYFVQSRTLSLDAFWISMPFGVLVALVLLANNIRDISHDRSKGISTIAIHLGRRKGLYLYYSLILLAYLGIIVMTITGLLPPWSLIVLISAPLAMRLLSTMLKQVPKDADARTAQLDTIFGLLLVISLVLGGL
ncbi:MAG: 1,4-dihydroxy-2-naphthoate octaprenyltransferase [Desulfobacterales bacterium]